MAPSSPQRLEARNISKAFAGNRVFRDISWKIASGETASVLGPNGAGKTTLLKCLCRLLAVDSGELLFQNKPLHPSSPLGIFYYVSSEDGGFYPRLTALENLQFFATLFGLKTAVFRERLKQGQEILEFPSLEKPYQKYSTGMKHRLSLLRSLLQNSVFLLLDEPTRSLDHHMCEYFENFLNYYRSLHPESAVLIATHDLNLAERISDHCLILENGAAKAQLRLDALRKQSQTLASFYTKTIEADHAS